MSVKYKVKVFINGNIETWILNRSWRAFMIKELENKYKNSNFKILSIKNI